MCPPNRDTYRTCPQKMNINTVIYFGCEALTYNEASKRWENSNYHTTSNGTKTELRDKNGKIILNILPLNPENYGAIYIPPDNVENWQLFDTDSMMTVRRPFAPLSDFVGKCSVNVYQAIAVKLEIGKPNKTGEKLTIPGKNSADHSLREYNITPKGDNKYDIEFVYGNGKKYVAKDVEVRSLTNNKDAWFIFRFKDGLPFRVDGELVELKHPSVANISPAEPEIPRGLQAKLDELTRRGGTNWADAIRMVFLVTLDEATAIAQADLQIAKLLPTAKPPETPSRESPRPDVSGGTAVSPKEIVLQNELKTLNGLKGGPEQVHTVETLWKSGTWDVDVAIEMTRLYIRNLKAEPAAPPPDPREAQLAEKLEIVAKRSDGAGWVSVLSNNKDIPIDSRIAQADILINQYVDSKLAELEKMGLEGKESAKIVRERNYKGGSWGDIDKTLDVIDRLVGIAKTNRADLAQKLVQLRAIRNKGGEPNTVADQIQRRVNEEKITFSTAIIKAEEEIKRLSAPISAKAVTPSVEPSEAKGLDAGKVPEPPVTPEVDDTRLSQTQKGDIETYLRQFEQALRFIKESIGGSMDQILLLDVKRIYTEAKEKVLGEKSGIPKEFIDKLKALDDVMAKGFIYLENSNSVNLKTFRTSLDPLPQKVDLITTGELNSSIKSAVEDLKVAIDALTTEPVKPAEPSYDEKYQAWLAKAIDEHLKDHVRLAFNFDRSGFSIRATYDENGFLIITVTLKEAKNKFDGSELNDFFAELKTKGYPLPWDNNFMPREYDPYKTKDKRWVDGHYYQVFDVATAYLLNYIPHKVVIKTPHECDPAEKRAITGAMEKNGLRPKSVDCQYDYTAKAEGSWEDFKRILSNDQSIHRTKYEVEKLVLSTKIGSFTIPKDSEIITAVVPFAKYNDFVSYLLNVIKSQNINLGSFIFFTSSFEDEDSAKLASKAHQIYTQAKDREGVNSAPRPFASNGTEDIPAGSIKIYIIPNGVKVVKIGR